MRRKEGMHRGMINPEKNLNPFKTKWKDRKSVQREGYEVKKRQGLEEIVVKERERKRRRTAEEIKGWTPEKTEAETIQGKSSQYTGQTEGMGPRGRGGDYNDRVGSRQPREKSRPYRKKKIRSREKKQGKKDEIDILLDDKRRSEITENLETFEDIPPDSVSDIVENQLTEERVLEEGYKEEIRNANQKQEDLDRDEYDVETIHPDDNRELQEGSRKSFSVKSGVNTGGDRPSKSKRQPTEKNTVYKRKSRARKQERRFKEKQEEVSL